MDYDSCKALLDRIEGCTFAALDTVTIPVLLGGKKNPFQGKIEKHALGHRVMLFTNQNSNAYLNKVRRHLEAEGKNPDSFQLSALPWGERIEHSPFIQHKGKHYLQCVFLASGSIEYRAREEILTNGFMDIGMSHYPVGHYIPAENIAGLNERSGSEHQGLENEVIVRTFCLDNIKALRAFQEELQ